MMGVPVQYLFLFSFVIQAVGQWQPYDCRRVNSQCRLNVGVCSKTTGMCDCTAAIPRIDGFQGFDCNLKTSSIRLSCTKCRNGGTCRVDSTGNETCYCSERFTGPTCEQARVDVTVCNETHIGMYIKPHHASIFNGLLSIIRETQFNSEILLTNPKCVKDGIADKEADNSFLFITPLDSTSPCYEALHVINRSDGVIRYEYKVRVNYAGFQSFADETHSFICEIQPSGPNGGVRVGNERQNLNGTTVTGTHFPASLNILTRSDRNPTGNASAVLLYIGQELFVQLTLKSTSRYTKLAVDSCEAFPNSDGSGQRVEFFKDRCPNDEFLSVVDNSVGGLRVSDSEVLVAFHAIRFLRTSDLYISCDLTLCTDANSQLCDNANCSAQSGGSFSGVGRRKRESDENVEYLTLSHHAVVLSSEGEVDALRHCESRTNNYSPPAETYLQNTLFLAMAVVSGVLLTVTLVISIVLCRRENSAYKTSE